MILRVSSILRPKRLSSATISRSRFVSLVNSSSIRRSAALCRLDHAARQARLLHQLLEAVRRVAECLQMAEKDLRRAQISQLLHIAAHLLDIQSRRMGIRVRRRADARERATMSRFAAGTASDCCGMLLYFCGELWST